MTIKSTVIETLRVGWLAIRYRLGFATAFAEPGQLLLRAFACHRQQVTFIQVGAHDGVTNDPLWPLIARGGWHGIRVEPLEELASLLRQLHANHRGILIEQVAIDVSDGTTTIHLPLLSPDDPAWMAQVASLDEDHVYEHQGGTEKPARRQETRIVRTLTLNSLCERHSIRSIDLLHIDAEGHDGKILLSVDWHRFAPTIILFEHTHLAQDELAELADLRRDLGYRECRLRFDTLWAKPGVGWVDQPFRLVWNLVVDPRAEEPRFQD